MPLVAGWAVVPHCNFLLPAPPDSAFLFHSPRIVVAAVIYSLVATASASASAYVSASASASASANLLSAITPLTPRPLNLAVPPPTRPL